MKHLLIIGAGPNQMPAIEEARRRGYRVSATDMDPNAVGRPAVDHFLIASTRDVEATVRAARTLHESEPLDGVMTMASESGFTVASVAKELGLPGLNPEVAWKAMHKVLRQEAFHAAHVPAPEYRKAITLEEAKAVASELGYPVVVKPVDSAGSRGVRKINTPNELDSALAEIREVSKQPELLIEEFLTGSEHSVEGVVIDGMVHWTAFSDRNYDKKEIYPPYFLEDGDTMPTSLNEEIRQQVLEVSTRAVHALGADWGPVKGDILVAEDGPRVIEMATRLSGDYFCYVTTPLHNGINLLNVVMDLSLGLPVDAESLHPQFEKGVALRYLWPKPGVVRSIEGLEQARGMEGIHFVRWEPRWSQIAPGARIEAARSMGERVGSVMAVGEDRSQAIARAEAAVRQIRIVTESAS